MSSHCYRSLTLLGGAIAWSVVSDCDISWSYTFTFRYTISNSDDGNGTTHDEASHQDHHCFHIGKVNPTLPP